MPLQVMTASICITAVLFGQLFVIITTLAQTTASPSPCPTISPAYPSPILASGWEAQLVVRGLNNPRGILFDSNGHLLVVQSGNGIINLEFTESGGSCITMIKQTYVVNSTEVSR